MKNLANCTTREFIRQTNKIRKAVKNWLEITKLLEIRESIPDLPKEGTKDELRRAAEEQVMQFLNAVLDSVLDEHPDETADLLGLICFIEPEDLDNYHMSELLGSVAECINNKDVLDFFISLGNLGMRFGSKPAKA